MSKGNTVFINYLKLAFKAENLPSWINLFALFAVFLTLTYQLEEKELESYKSSLITEMVDNNQPIESRNEKLFSSAIADLLRDKVVLNTNAGYELNSYTPRITEDISIVTLILSRDFKKSELECNDLMKQVISANEMLHKIEEVRNNEYKKESYNDYLSRYQHLTIKSLFRWQDMSYLNNQRDCFLKLINNSASSKKT